MDKHLKENLTMYDFLMTSTFLKGSKKLQLGVSKKCKSYGTFAFRRNG